jgi:TonB family protein
VARSDGYVLRDRVDISEGDGRKMKGSVSVWSAVSIARVAATVLIAVSATGCSGSEPRAIVDERKAASAAQPEAHEAVSRKGPPAATAPEQGTRPAGAAETSPPPDSVPTAISDQGSRAPLPGLVASGPGYLPRKSIVEVVATQRSRFRWCYETRLASNPNLAGKISVRFTISGKGRVSDAVVASSSVGDPLVERCVVDAFKRLVFPPPSQGEDVVVTYPLRFDPEE